MKRLEPAHEKVSQSATNVTSTAKAKMEEVQEGVQNTLNSALESTSSTASNESEATPASSSSASSQSTQTQMDDSSESVSLRDFRRWCRGDTDFPYSKPKSWPRSKLHSELTQLRSKNIAALTGRIFPKRRERKEKRREKGDKRLAQLMFFK